MHLLPPPSPSLLEHSGVMSLWDSFEKSSEQKLIALLHSRLSSESAEIWRSVGASRDMVFTWLYQCQKDRLAQVLLLRLITNTIPKSKGKKLICPWCNLEASTEHLLTACPSLREGSEEALAFSCSAKLPYHTPTLDLKTFGKNPRLLPSFCLFNRPKLLVLLRRSSGFTPSLQGDSTVQGEGC